MCDSLLPHGLQHIRLSCPLQSPSVVSNSNPLSRWCYWTILSAAAPFSSFPQSFPASWPFPVSQLFTQMGKVSELQLQHQSFQWILRVDFLQDWLVWCPCSPGDSQESSSPPQFKSISRELQTVPYVWRKWHEIKKDYMHNYVYICIKYTWEDPKKISHCFAWGKNSAHLG